ncbi:MAG: deoxyhypusine synthase family protein [Planctomycetes bacterium]|nr:deoxyhypusine synthase family protein [Planctomycetota bacterium]
MTQSHSKHSPEEIARLQKKHLGPPLDPFDPVKNSSVASVLESMSTQVSFQGRNLGRAFKVWRQALSEKTVLLFGLAGAMVPAGMRKTLVYLIENRLIDVIVSTGANLFHDIHETLGYYHYLGHHQVDDVELCHGKMDRIYDTLVKDKEFAASDEYLAKFASALENRPYSTAEFFNLLGKKLETEKDSRIGILTAAAKAGVPVYCPSVSDSSIGIALVSKFYTNKKPFLFDILRGVSDLGRVVAAAPQSGIVFISGGVPKNFIQQSEITADLMGLGKPGHRYAIQLTTDAPHWGGLSGCTFEEGQSWGKIAAESEKVTVFCDATIALPLLVTGLAEVKAGANRPWKPEFTIGVELGFKFDNS